MATALFSSEQLAALTAPLDSAKVRQREQGRSTISYLEGWQVIAEATGSSGSRAGSAKPSSSPASTNPSAASAARAAAAGASPTRPGSASTSAV